MQDRYVGDLGDYLKLGLLRWLTAGPFAPRLGVIWYRTADEGHNSDGKHVSYLRDDHPMASLLCPLDPDLYAGLSSLVHSGRRTVSALSDAAILPAGTVYFNDLLDFSDIAVQDRSARVDRRAVWLDAALAATNHCDVVFVDPDNGIRSVTHRAGSHRNRSVKHAYLNELAEFVDRGQALVVYHHADRSAAATVQAQRRLADLARETGATPIAAVKASRGTTRLFLVAAPAGAATGDLLTARLRELSQSPWGRELQVKWPS